MILKSYQKQIEGALVQSIELMGERNPLRDACEYALLSGGKRLRPALVLMVAEALGFGLDVMPAALSTEFFHTASLVADDLPCMDNDDERRGRPSVHKKFGQSVALLASYTLIAEGYGGIYRNSKLLKESSKFASQADQVAVIALEAATGCAGSSGATYGQFLDLYPPTDPSIEMIQKMIYLKTGTLFEISFVFGWLFGGGAPSQLPSVRTCACHLGMAFQIADDLQDGAQDKMQESANIAAVCGKERAYELFQNELASWINCLKTLGLWTPAFEEAADLLTCSV